MGLMDDGMDLVASADSEQFESVTLTPKDGSPLEFDAAIYSDTQSGVMAQAHNLSLGQNVCVFVRIMDLPDDFAPQVRDILTWKGLDFSYVETSRQDSWHLILIYKLITRNRDGNMPALRL